MKKYISISKMKVILSLIIFYITLSVTTYNLCIPSLGPAYCCLINNIYDSCTIFAGDKASVSITNNYCNITFEYQDLTNYYVLQTCLSCNNDYSNCKGFVKTSDPNANAQITLLKL
jgi:hypothetical protein